MPFIKALVLYTNGTYEIIKLKSYKDYQNIVGGTIQSIPVESNYFDYSNNQKTLYGYCNEDFIMKQLKINPYSNILSLLGFSDINIQGNIIILNDNKEDDNNQLIDIDPDIISIIECYNASDSKSKYLFELKERQRHILK